MAQALVPLKDLVQAKTRLAGLLRPSERRALAQAMVEDVLAVLAGHPDIAHVTLLSDDPGAGMLARKYGADCWSERALACRGLNPLIERASARLLATGEEPLLVLHGDLPLLTQEDISAVLAARQASGGLIIGTDRTGSGTNLLAFNTASVPRFCFGIDSCAGHRDSAASAGIPVQILQRSGIAVDVDEPADLKCVMERLRDKPAGNTAALLYHTELGSRLALALAMLASAAQAPDEADRGSVN
jgi:2-phospho-L-lactate guanylyltransferase